MSIQEAKNRASALQASRQIKMTPRTHEDDPAKMPPPPGPPPPLPMEPKEKVEDEEEVKSPSIDLDMMREILMSHETALADPDRRKDIETRCSELSLSDLISLGAVKQKIDIVPGSYSVELRTVSSIEDMEVKKLLYAEATLPDMSSPYLQTKAAVYYLALAVVRLNDLEFPKHMVNGAFDKAMFEKKFETLARQSIQVLVDLNVQNRWFAQRVERLVCGRFEAAKN